MTGPTDPITRVIHDYGFAIDSKDWPLLASCFTADAHVVFAADPKRYPGLAPREWHSSESFVAFIARTHESLATFHSVTNLVLDSEGPGKASARCHARSVLVSGPDGDGQKLFESLGYYRDRLVETDAGWKIAERVYTRLLSVGTYPV